jgi:hypothetical protein
MKTAGSSSSKALWVSPLLLPVLGARVLETLRRWQGKFTVAVDGLSLPTAMTFGRLQMVLDSPLAWVKS